ncbi:hypothetical protein BDK51DRAFT_45739 [Blyttiomyces helicus]|uniref:Uncharacterized protein n=1 Tax=Blyttiomyces helicus TaxID=388810 RepID=A0A4P9W5X3_9FUNG|nr:hypothetical protein BDK51DRAFT_45739 [Blyttiomyces helicus]|eukprot:RKO86150.1 hypothetical protein BDK51DRAFT_45739 [Blyttiomyces helicus]
MAIIQEPDHRQRRIQPPTPQGVDFIRVSSFQVVLKGTPSVLPDVHQMLVNMAESKVLRPALFFCLEVAEGATIRFERAENIRVKDRAGLTFRFGGPPAPAAHDLLPRASCSSNEAPHARLVSPRALAMSRTIYAASSSPSSIPTPAKANEFAGQELLEHHVSRFCSDVLSKFVDNLPTDAVVEKPRTKLEGLGFIRTVDTKYRSPDRRLERLAPQSRNLSSDPRLLGPEVRSIAASRRRYSYLRPSDAVLKFRVLVDPDAPSPANDGATLDQLGRAYNERSPDGHMRFSPGAGERVFRTRHKESEEWTDGRISLNIDHVFQSDRGAGEQGRELWEPKMSSVGSEDPEGEEGDSVEKIMDKFDAFVEMGRTNVKAIDE